MLRTFLQPGFPALGCPSVGQKQNEEHAGSELGHCADLSSDPGGSQEE